MYNPFVLACNYALDRLSRVNIEGLPQCTPERRIVFVRNHDRSLKSNSHQREPQVKPDIVLLRWERFAKLVKGSSTGNYSYSDSYSRDICTSRSNFNLSWRNIRSTVEMKVTGLPRHRDQKKTYATGLRALTEKAPYTSLNDSPQLGYMPENLPDYTCEFPSPKMFQSLICSDRRHQLGESG